MPAPLVRETSYGKLAHPETLPDGRGLWVDPEVQDLIRILHHGDPVLGWEGDPRLALYRTADRRWELWRLEADGEYRPVMRSKPDTKLDHRLILKLVEMDRNRGFDAHEHLRKLNERNQLEREARAAEAVAAAEDKVRWAIGKDTNTGKKVFSLAGLLKARGVTSGR